MSTKRGRVRRHSISSLEEAAKKVAKESASEPSQTDTMPSVQNEQSMHAEGHNPRKRPLPFDHAASLANDMSPAKKFAILTGGLTMEDLLKSAPAQGHATGGDQYLCLPGGKESLYIKRLLHVFFLALYDPGWVPQYEVLPFELVVAREQHIIDCFPEVLVLVFWGIT